MLLRRSKEAADQEERSQSQSRQAHEAQQESAPVQTAGAKDGLKEEKGEQKESRESRMRAWRGGHQQRA